MGNQSSQVSPSRSLPASTGSLRYSTGRQSSKARLLGVSRPAHTGGASRGSKEHVLIEKDLLNIQPRPCSAPASMRAHIGGATTAAIKSESSEEDILNVLPYAFSGADIQKLSKEVESEVEKVKREKEAAAERLAAVELEKEDLHRRLKQSEAEKAELSRSMEEKLQADIQKLSKELESEVEKVKREKEAAAERLAAVELEKEDLHRRLKRSEAEKAELSRSMEEKLQGASSALMESLSMAEEIVSLPLQAYTEVWETDTACKIPCGSEAFGKLEVPDVGHERRSPREPTSPEIKLDLAAMLALRTLQDNESAFSYYVLPPLTVVIHLEEMLDEAIAEGLKNSVSNIVQQCCKEAEINTVVIGRSFGATLCTNRIGSLLDVDGRHQTIGMYVQHEGVVYWVSCAHNLKPAQRVDGSSIHHLADNATDGMHREKPHVYFVEDDTAGGLHDRYKIKAPTPYACLSYNYLPGVTGRLLRHFVDITVGHVPTLASDVESDTRQHMGGMHAVYDTCRTCGKDNCAATGHVRGGKRYAVDEIKKLEPLADECYAHYDAHSLRRQVLLCCPRNQEVVAGEVVAYQNGYLLRTGMERIWVDNVLMIRRTGSRGPSPQQGDSGSVWVLENESMAVAMTVGLGSTAIDGQDVTVWLAALLHPSLDAFCAAHPNVLPVDDFKPIGPCRLSHASPSPSTHAGSTPGAPRRPNASMAEGRSAITDSGFQHMAPEEATAEMFASVK